MSIRVQPEIVPWDVGGVHRGWRWARWSLAVSTLVVLVTAVVAGQHSASWGRLVADLDTGGVRTVWVRGDLPPGATGYSTVEVRWREGLFWRQVQVLEVRGIRTPAGGGHGEGTSAVVRGDVGARLVQLRPGVHVIRQQDRSGGSGTVMGWEVPAWIGFATLALWMAAVALLILHPEPWSRATRWAWFWLMLLMPVGTLAFCLLAGPTPLIPAPRTPARRLTGGWAVLLTVFLGALLAS